MCGLWTPLPFSLLRHSFICCYRFWMEYEAPLDLFNVEGGGQTSPQSSQNQRNQQVARSSHRGADGASEWDNSTEHGTTTTTTSAGHQQSSAGRPLRQPTISGLSAISAGGGGGEGATGNFHFPSDALSFEGRVGNNDEDTLGSGADVGHFSSPLMDAMVIACQNEREAPDLLPYPATLVRRATEALVASRRAVVGLTRQHRRRLARIDRRRRGLGRSSVANADDEEELKAPDATDDDDVLPDPSGSSNRLVGVTLGGDGIGSSRRVSYCRAAETTTATAHGGTALKVGYVSLFDVLEQKRQQASALAQRRGQQQQQHTRVKHEDDKDDALVDQTSLPPPPHVGIIAAEYTSVLGDESVTYPTDDGGSWDTAQQAATSDVGAASLPFQPHDLLGMELVRLEFLLSELLRVRLQKIQALAQRIYFYESIPEMLKREAQVLKHYKVTTTSNGGPTPDDTKSPFQEPPQRSATAGGDLVVSWGGAGGAAGLLQHALVRRHVSGGLLSANEQIVMAKVVELYERCASETLPTLQHYEPANNGRHQQQQQQSSPSSLIGGSQRLFYLPRITAPSIINAYRDAVGVSASSLPSASAMYVPLPPPISSATSGPNHTSAGGGVSRASQHAGPQEHRHHQLLVSLAKLRREGAGFAATTTLGLPPPGCAQLYPSPLAATTVMLPEPHTRKRVFYRVRTDLGTVELDSGTNAERVMEAGDVVMAPYATLEHHLLASSVRIL